MSKVTINGTVWYECLDCGHWTHGLCGCKEESKSQAVVKLLNIFRIKYNNWIFTTPFHGNKNTNTITREVNKK